MVTKTKRIAINTGGGDAPGLNAVIRATVLAAVNRGWKCYGIREGYMGLLEPQDYPEGGLFKLTRRSVRGITHLGGTILGTTNRGNPLNYPVTDKNGQTREVDRTDYLVEALRKHKIDALISIGGDGSLAIANALAEKGVRVIGVPKTIDNDLDKTIITFGFDSAVSFATAAVDRLHSTAEAHRRVMVVEVMGRYAGWIALNVGVSGTADAILIPEIPYDLQKGCRKGRRARVARPKVCHCGGSGRRSSERRNPFGGWKGCRQSRTPGRDRRKGFPGTGGVDRQGYSGGSAGPFAARWVPDYLRPVNFPSLRSGRSTRVGGGSVGRHGGFRSANRPLRPTRRSRPRHEGSFSGFGHCLDCSRSWDQFRRLVLPSNASELISA